MAIIFQLLQNASATPLPDSKGLSNPRLRCSLFENNRDYDIRVKIPNEEEERVSLKVKNLKTGCCSCNNRYYPYVELLVDGQMRRLRVSINSIANRWHISDREIQSACLNETFQDLALKAAQMVRWERSLSLYIDDMQKRIDAAKFIRANIPLWQRQCEERNRSWHVVTPTAKSKLGYIFFSHDKSIQALLGQTTLDLETGESYDREGEFSTEALEKMSAEWDIHLARCVQNEPERAGIIAFIQKNLFKWQAQCKGGALRNIYIPAYIDRSLPIEYFVLDQSIYVHLNTERPLSLNLITGELCQREGKDLKDLPKWRRIQELFPRCRGIVPIYQCASYAKGGQTLHKVILGFYQSTLFKALWTYVDKGEQLTSKRKFNEKEIDQITEDLILGLAALHSKNIVHGGICVYSILFKRDPGSQKAHAAISYFNTIFDAANPPDQIRITSNMKNMIPPECKEGPEQEFIDLKKVKDPRAIDVYQLGLVLEELRKGSEPATSLPSTPVPRIPSKPARIQTLIRRMLDPEPAARITAADALQLWADTR